jgi:branched-chain amino acid transport system substrate-binding protein
MKRHQLRWLAIVALAPLALACGTKPPVPVVAGPDGKRIEPPPAPKKQDEDLARDLAADAAKLAAEGNPSLARAKEEQLLASYPATLPAASIYQARALLAERAGNLDEAVAYYEKLLFYRPSFEGIDTIREHYAALLLQAGRPADAANMLRALFANAADVGVKLRLGESLIAALAAADHGGEALLVLADLISRQDVAAATRDSLVARALEIVDGGLSFKDAASLWSKVSDDGALAALQPALAFKLAKIYYHVRDFKRSEEMAQLVATRYASSPIAAQARDFLARLHDRFQVDPRAIGIALPLTGKYEQYGARALIAIKQAFVNDNVYKLVVKDTQGDPTAASQAIEDLVMKDHVVGIIGTLFSNEAQSAALKAEELSVPLLTLSHREGLPEIGANIFRTALTVQAQAKALAAVAFDKLNMSRFALLYPRSSYGLDFVRTFWDEVDRRQGEIRAAETYEIDQTTFTEPVKRLVGRFYMYARQDFKDGILEIKAKKLPPHKVAAEVEKLEKHLPPLVDFDAIIIPDSSRNIGLIAPALAFEDIVMERDPKELEKIKKATGNQKIHPVTLLGASTWNSPQTVSSCERYCEGAIFVDAFYPDSPDQKVRDFVTSFRDEAGIDPHLSEAQAYDTAGLLRAVLRASKPADRAALQTQLRQSAAYDGLTGKLQFDASGEVRKELFVLTIDKGEIKKLDEPPAEPRG